MKPNLLQVKNIITSFKTERGVLRAVDDVSFDIKEGQTLGLVGESGSGKSVTSLSIMRLLDAGSGNVESGKILFEGEDILKYTPEQMRKVRGNHIGMIFQEPMTSLNPVFTIGNQIAESYQIHQKLSYKEALKKSIDMLHLVKMPDPEKRIHEYPHQLSGGMRQRVMIAMALACQPKLLIADEPTTALDVTIQAQILQLMADLQKELGMAILLITHDLGVVAEVCDDVLVMYAGQVIEQGSVENIFNSPKHPYTEALLSSIPRLGKKVSTLTSIAGVVPPLDKLPKGCRFNDRCSKAMKKCHDLLPGISEFTENHRASCWLYNNSNEETA